MCRQGIDGKKTYIEEIEKYLGSSGKQEYIIMGDLNIIARDHVPHYTSFFAWEYDFYDNILLNGYTDAFRYCFPGEQEYSRVGRTNNGYRYDYCFVSSKWKPHLCYCEYLHEPRSCRLTDHSAVVAGLLFQEGI